MSLSLSLKILDLNWSPIAAATLDCDKIVYSMSVKWWLAKYIVLIAFSYDDIPKSIL